MSHGCRPVDEPYIVADAQDVVITELGSGTLMQRLDEARYLLCKIPASGASHRGLLRFAAWPILGAGCPNSVLPRRRTPLTRLSNGRR